MLELLLVSCYLSVIVEIYAFDIVVAVPILVSHPSSQYIYPTQTATFTCNANGYNVVYQWRIRTGSFPSKVLGIRSNTLIIPNVTSSDENAYTCIASNAAGSAISHTAVLTVTGKVQVYVFGIVCISHLYPYKFVTFCGT